MLTNLTLTTPQQKEIHQHFDELFKNEKVNFSKRLDQLREAQNNTITTHGREGMMVVLNHQLLMYAEEETVQNLQLFHYTETPANNPWNGLQHLPLPEAIRQVWKNWPNQLSVALEEFCTDLFVLQASGIWFLIYVYHTTNYQKKSYHDFLMGREAENDAKLPLDLVKAGWTMPQDLKTFYSVHSNFGSLTASLKNENVYCIASANTLKASLDFLEEHVEEWELDYSFLDLLPFCGNGAGNEQCFYKPTLSNGSYQTVYWDHETREKSADESFEHYLDELFGDKARGKSHW